MGSVTALKKKKEEDMFSIDAVLTSAAVTKEKSSSSRVPVLTVSADLQAKAARLRELKEQIDSLMSEFDLTSADVIEAVEPLRVQAIRKQGYTSSVKVPDSKGMSISVTWSSNYSKTPLENKAALASILDERFEGFFNTRMVIKVKDVGEESLKDLISAVGAEQFARFFEVERWLEPTRRYTEEFCTAFDEAERARLSAMVKQYKPSIKVK